MSSRRLLLPLATLAALLCVAPQGARAQADKGRPSGSTAAQAQAEAQAKRALCEPLPYGDDRLLCERTCVALPPSEQCLLTLRFGARVAPFLSAAPMPGDHVEREARAKGFDATDALKLRWFVTQQLGWPDPKGPTTSRKLIRPEQAMALSRMLREAGTSADPASQRSAIKRAVEEAERVYGANDVGLLPTLDQAARLATDAQGHDLAMTLNARALAIRERALPDEHPELALARLAMARQLIALSLYVPAQQLIGQAERALSSVFGPLHPHHLAPDKLSITTRARPLIQRGDPEGALASTQQLITLRAQVLGPSSEDDAQLAEIAWRAGDIEAADLAARRAMSAAPTPEARHALTLTHAQRLLDVAFASREAARGTTRTQAAEDARAFASQARELLLLRHQALLASAPKAPHAALLNLLGRAATALDEHDQAARLHERAQLAFEAEAKTEQAADALARRASALDEAASQRAVQLRAPAQAEARQLVMRWLDALPATASLPTQLATIAAMEAVQLPADERAQRLTRAALTALRAAWDERALAPPAYAHDTLAAGLRLLDSPADAPLLLDLALLLSHHRQRQEQHARALARAHDALPERAWPALAQATLSVDPRARAQARDALHTEAPALRALMAPASPTREALCAAADSAKAALIVLVPARGQRFALVARPGCAVTRVLLGSAERLHAMAKEQRDSARQAAACDDLDAPGCMNAIMTLDRHNAALYQALWTPLIEAGPLPEQIWAFIHDDALRQVPLDALRAPSGQHLVEQHALRMMLTSDAPLRPAAPRATSAQALYSDPKDSATLGPAEDAPLGWTVCARGFCAGAPKAMKRAWQARVKAASPPQQPGICPSATRAPSLLPDHDAPQALTSTDGATVIAAFGDSAHEAALRAIMPEQALIVLRLASTSVRARDCATTRLREQPPYGALAPMGGASAQSAPSSDAAPERWLSARELASVDLSSVNLLALVMTDPKPSLSNALNLVEAAAAGGARWIVMTRWRGPRHAPWDALMASALKAQDPAITLRDAQRQLIQQARSAGQPTRPELWATPALWWAAPHSP